MSKLLSDYDTLVYRYGSMFEDMEEEVRDRAEDCIRCRRGMVTAKIIFTYWLQKGIVFPEAAEDMSFADLYCLAKEYMDNLRLFGILVDASWKHSKKEAARLDVQEKYGSWKQVYKAQDAVAFYDPDPANEFCHHVNFNKEFV